MRRDMRNSQQSKSMFIVESLVKKHIMCVFVYNCNWSGVQCYRYYILSVIFNKSKYSNLTFHNRKLLTILQDI